MKISMYSCDLCKKEYRPTSNGNMASMGIHLVIDNNTNDIWKYKDTCPNCYDKIVKAFLDAVNSLKV